MLAGLAMSTPFVVSSNSSYTRTKSFSLLELTSGAPVGDEADTGMGRTEMASEIRRIIGKKL